MVAFNLSTFPEVCRLCLQTKHPDEMISIETKRPMYSGTLKDVLEEFTFKIPECASHYFPTEVCLICLEVLDFFYKYKQKITHIHLFLKAFVDVKLGDNDPLVQLLNDNKEYYSILFKDLDLCNKDDLLVEDMLEEYHHYKIATMPDIIKKEHDHGKRVEAEEMDDFNLHVETLESYENAKDDHYVKRFLEEIGDFKNVTKEQKLIEIKAEPVLLLPAIGCDSKLNIEEQPYCGSDQLDDFSQDSALKDDIDETEYSLNTVNPDENELEEKSKATDVHLRLHEQEDKHSKFYDSSCLPVLNIQQQFKDHRPQDIRKKHVCDICGATLKHKYSLEVHLARHAGVTQFQCQYCSASFHTKTETRNHLRSIHTTGSSCECSKCGAVFKNKKLLNQHLESHVEKRNFKCETCEFAFKTMQHLKRHITTVHREVRFSCNHCAMSYGRKDKLRMHIERTHSIQSYFNCDICLRSFDGKSALDEHMGHHASPKPLECGVCLMAFEDKVSFDEHMCISYRDDYKCCGKDFKYHVHYNRHMLMEHGIKSNARVKPKRGLLIGQLRADRRQRTVQCRKCSQSFSSVTERKGHDCIGTRLNIYSGNVLTGPEECVDSNEPMQMCEMGEEEHLEEVYDNVEINNETEYIISEVMEEEASIEC
ncbi:zinc finger protein 616-like [Topomyia yanbarensis]|uniref:zinc finger protein 616-like n=1 Tax=Topomyia yanbarensis TaxID=2498891 RepID=UPI00273AC25B|nr:zinc finger protein 616-like [Topomyia yanbarensis]XP_058833793.1 zinc finger protein 616-like [Topomyia yanbarensis]